MMIDREKVAARLRAKHEEYAASGLFEVQDAGMQAYDRLKDLIGCLPDGEDVFVTLADLIDPTCVAEWHHDGSIPYQACSRCGEPFERVERHCPNCGARVMEDD